MTNRYCEFCHEWTDALECAECGSATLPAESPNPRERGDDDGAEYGDPRDYRDGRE